MTRYGLTAFAARRVALHPARWLLLGGALGVVTFLTATLIMTQLAVEATASRVIDAGPALVVSRVDAGGWASIDELHAGTIAAIPGVESAVARVWGVPPGPPSLTVVADPQLPDGSNLARVGGGVRLAKPGELLVLRGLDGAVHELRVDAAIGAGADVVAHDVVLVPRDVARSLLLLRAGAATDLAVDTARDEENDALVVEIAQALSFPVRVTTRAQMRGAYLSQTGRSGSLALVALLPALLGLLLVVATTSAGGASSRAEVGKLKLLGWTTGDVARLHATEMGLVGSVAVGLGLAAAYVGLFVLGASTVASSFLGWDDPAPNLTLSTEGAVLSLLSVGACVLVPCVVASLVPSFRLASSDPADLVEGP